MDLFDMPTWQSGLLLILGGASWIALMVLWLDGNDRCLCCGRRFESSRSLADERTSQ